MAVPVNGSSSRNRWLDVSGVALSVACVAHCLALPVAAALLPILGGWAEAAWVHWTFAALAVPVSAYAMLHPSPKPPTSLLIMAGVGLLLLVLGAAGWPDPTWERGVTLVGGVLLAAAHIWNGRWRSKGAGARRVGSIPRLRAHALAAEPDALGG